MKYGFDKVEFEVSSPVAEVATSVWILRATGSGGNNSSLLELVQVLLAKTKQASLCSRLELASPFCRRLADL